MIQIPALFLAVLLLISPYAQAAELRRISLKEAVAEGLERNHQVRAATYETTAAEAGARVSASHYWPQLFFEESVSASNTPTRTFMMKLDQGRFTQNDFQINNLNNPKTVTDFRTSVTWEQPLFVPAAFAERRIAARDAEQQRIAQTTTREQTAFRIFQTYLDVQKSAAYLQASRQSLVEAQESRRLAQARTAAGLGLKSDELRVGTHLSVIEQQVVTATNNLTLARLQLALLTGGRPDEELEIIPLTEELTVPTSLEELAEKALAVRSDVRHAQAALEKADATVLAARSAYLPSLAGVAGYQLNDHRNPFNAEHDAWMAGLNLRWNLFDGFRRENRHEKASASRSAAVELLEQSRRTVQYQLHENWLRRHEVEKQYMAARSSVVSAQETVRLLSRRFENDLATMLELLDAQSALNQTRAMLVESETNRYLATGRIWYAAGIFLQEVQK